MAWVKIPNGIVEYLGKPVKWQKLDANGEGVYKPIRCPVQAGDPPAECPERFTNWAAFREHIADAHDTDPATLRVPLPEPELEDATIGRMVMGLVFQLRSGEQGNPYAAIRKPLDGSRSDEVVRRIRNAQANRLDYWHLKDDDHVWLIGVLDRKLPIVVDGKIVKGSEAKDFGVEQQTVSMALFGLSEDAVRLALTPLDKRPKRAAEPDDPDAAAIAAKAQEEQPTTRQEVIDRAIATMRTAEARRDESSLAASLVAEQQGEH